MKNRAASLADIAAQIRRALAAEGNQSSDFDLNPDVVLPEGRKLTPAAVLVPLIEAGGTWKVILTKRSSALRNHAGQVAFPGGRQDPEDPDLISTALRESREEIGLQPDKVDILGALPAHETVTGFTAQPVVGLVREEFTPMIDPAEVAEVFQVPLDHLLEVANYRIESRIWRGVRRYFYTVPYGPYYIWGATARMLRALADRMAQ